MNAVNQRWKCFAKHGECQHWCMNRKNMYQKHSEDHLESDNFSVKYDAKYLKLTKDEWTILKSSELPGYCFRVQCMWSLKLIWKLNWKVKFFRFWNSSPVILVKFFRLWLQHHMIFVTVYNKFHWSPPKNQQYIYGIFTKSHFWQVPKNFTKTASFGCVWTVIWLCKPKKQLKLCCISLSMLQLICLLLKNITQVVLLKGPCV